MIERPAMLGPHEGKELELLLADQKPIALFYEGIPEEFLPYLESDVLKLKTKIVATQFAQDIEFKLIYKNIENEKQVDELMAVLQQSIQEALFIPEIERKIGELLGYREIDIDYYLAHITRTQRMA